MPTGQLERTTFSTSRLLEFFTEKELQMQIGHPPHRWALALVKELIDNALDACETADVAPVVEVKVEADSFSVQDNGPGLPAETLKRSLDYLKRVSNKNFYVSPTRGQMGNALKVVWAAPFVFDGEHGRIEVWSQGLHHTVEVSLDRIVQRPVVEHAQEDAIVKSGTLVKLHWRDSASSLRVAADGVFYNVPGDWLPVPSVQSLVEAYAAFNPHASFQIDDTRFEATDVNWAKWKPGDPTSPHWYTRETLRDLIAAYVAVERDNGRARTVREFVSEFRGLSSTVKQKEVTGDLSGVYLRDLIRDGDIDMARVERLLANMQAVSRAPKPSALGVVDEDHIKRWMVTYANVAEESVRYKKCLGVDNLPYVVEVGFGVRKDEREGRRIVIGLNWSPALGSPVPMLDVLLGKMRVDLHDPVTVVAHLARPRFEFVDRGKTRLQL